MNIQFIEKTVKDEKFWGVSQSLMRLFNSRLSNRQEILIIDFLQLAGLVPNHKLNTLGYLINVWYRLNVNKGEIPENN